MSFIFWRRKGANQAFEVDQYNRFPVETQPAPDEICIGYEQITVAATALPLTAAQLLKRPTRAAIDIETAQIRWRADGIAPTTTVGGSVLAGGIITVTGSDLQVFQMIRATSTSATANVSYFQKRAASPAGV